MADLITIGDSDIDLFMKVANDTLVEDDSENRPKICFYHGTKIPVEQFETSVAGNALNVAVGCTKLGIKTALYTEIGDDQNADKLVEELGGYGVETDLVSKNKGTLTDAHTVVVYEGERTIFSYHGPRVYDIKDWDTPKWIYYSSMAKGFENFQKELIDYVKTTRVGLAFNPGTMHIKIGVESIKNVLTVCDILFLNKEEAELFCGTDKTKSTDELTLHKALHKMGPKLTVITNGSKGATAYDGSVLVSQASYSDDKTIIDTTGAGDAFSSGFMSAIIYGKSLKEALKWGVINSGNSIKEMGALKGLTDKKTIEKLAGSIK